MAGDDPEVNGSFCSFGGGEEEYGGGKRWHENTGCASEGPKGVCFGDWTVQESAKSPGFAGRNA